MTKLTKKKQDELIQKEINAWEEIFEEISEDKRRAAKRLIERVSFMTITLEILEDDIKTNGATYLFEQGSQKMIIENPSQKSYNTMINRYTAAYAKLTDLLPKEVQKEIDDGFESFVNKK